MSVTAKSVDDGAFGQLEIGPVPKLAEQRASCSAVVIASPLRSVLRRVIVIAESGRDDEPIALSIRYHSTLPTQIVRNTEKDS